jgi:cellulose biosynthesis protein BcsQ
MSVIAFASLKGGVGKTSLSVNIAHAFAYRGCMTLLIDLDPSAHATRLFHTRDSAHLFPGESPLARMLLKKKSAETSQQNNAPFVVSVRKLLELLPGGKELRYFVPAQGAKFFAKRFPLLLNELKTHFDHIVIDTPPEFNILTRTAAACANIVVAPVDASEMGIHSVEELLDCSKHLKRPAWALVRTMVNSKAGRTRVLSHSRLEANLILTRSREPEDDAQDGLLTVQNNVADNQTFMKMFQGWTPANGADETHRENARSVYLLDAAVHRTEAQNQLSFLSRTAFDSKKTVALARQYLAVAREIEDILSAGQEEDEEDETANLSHRLTEISRAN